MTKARTFTAALILSCALQPAQAQVPEGLQLTAAPAVYRFGIDTRWTYGYITTAKPCSIQTFAGTDPAPGVVKKCEVVGLNTATCVLPIMGGGGLNPDFGFSGATGGAGCPGGVPRPKARSFGSWRAGYWTASWPPSAS